MDEIKEDPLFYNLYKDVENPQPSWILDKDNYTSMNIHIRAMRPICGLEFSKRGQTLCGRYVNHKGQHITSILREENGTLRDAHTTRYFNRPMQAVLTYDFNIKYTDYSNHFSVLIYPSKVDLVALRQHLFDNYYYTWFLRNYKNIDFPIRNLEDLRHFKFDYFNAIVSCNTLKNLDLINFKTALANPDIPHPHFFSEKFLSENADFAKNIAYLKEKP